MSQEWFEDDARADRIDTQLWRRILSHARPYRRPLWAMAISGLVIALVDVALPWVTGRIVDDATVGGGTELFRWIGIYIALATLFAFVVYFFIEQAGRISTGFAYDVRKKGFRKLQELSFSFYDKRPVGWLMARLTSDIGTIASVLPWTTLDLVWGTALVVGISATMLMLDWKLGLFVLLIVPPLGWVSTIFQRKLIDSQRRVRRANSKLTAGFNEGIMGVRTTKSLVREEKNLEEFQVLSTDMFGHTVQNALQSAIYLPMVMSLGSVGVGLALWQGGVKVGLGGLSLGEMITFMNYATLFSMPIQELAARFTQVQAAQASAERLQTLLDTEPEVVDSEIARASLAARKEELANAGVVLEDRFGADEDLAAILETAPDGHAEEIHEIEFRQVSFAYNPSEPVLDRVSFRVRRGQTVALVGSTGSGKSTVVSLLSRFYEPTSGEILVDGVEYRDRSLDWWQSNFGVVLQTPHLFSGTLAENIRYGRLDATDAEVEAAARQVGADSFVRELRDGFQTEVGEGGSRLSTGQKQLVSLARAILADPQVFIMDEATSSVDTATERLIQKGIERLLSGRISFVIAHRLSTIRDADQILVLDHGRIIERGTHSELLALKGRYHHLYTNQATREDAERALAAGQQP
ncbi:MAG: ABC transporter ATP-binding protein [Candidatus Eisenbacteria bacterium]|uniref:ABC transporter ATP-binding protein n=1 Tax=Eiseniibacteriota bacterium TaxID=2212470 RepID=A0A956SDL0_UNCEI|nr:ABC transporter ATP-binding protein [Candidatus Eisenbacteria bacterium]